MKKIVLFVSCFYIAIGSFFSSKVFALDYALCLDGAHDYIRVYDNPSIDFSSGMTIEAWVKTADTAGLRTIVSKWDDLNGDWSYIFKQWNYTDKLSIQLSKGGHSDLGGLIGPTSVPINTWVHVATTFDGNYVKLYLNGEQDGSLAVSGSINNSTSDLLIGAVNGWSGLEYFNGSIDEVRLWNYSRTQTDLLAWMNKTLVGDEAGLVGYWNFDEGSGQEIHDLTINHNDGYFASVSNPDELGPEWVLSGDKPTSGDSVVPEPASLSLLGLGLSGLLFKRKKRIV